MQLLAGWAAQEFSIDRPVELHGQYYQRISRGVRDPLMATALALEQPDGSRTHQAVMVSVDTVFVTRDFQDEVRHALRTTLPELDPATVVLNATHTHSGPSWYAPFRWWSPAENAMTPAEIRTLMLEGVVSAIQAAWRSRQPAGVSSASAYETTGFCRRVLYSNGQAEMYGKANRPDFVGIEAGADDEVRMLFTWNPERQLTGIVLNVACPAQVLESQYVVSADFVGELRQHVHAVFGPQVGVLVQISAAGDLSPRNLPIQQVDEANSWQESGLIALTRRLGRAIETAVAAARARIDFAPALRHGIQNIVLPVRRVSVEDHQRASAQVKHLTRGHPDTTAASKAHFRQFLADVADRERQESYGPFDDKGMDFVLLENELAVISRFEMQQRTVSFPVELHAIRLADCAFVFNPFELYVDFGHAIRARSHAAKTFVVQLACDAGGYLPTHRAVAAGGYGALVINGNVGPDAGIPLVEASLEEIARLWK